MDTDMASLTLKNSALIIGSMLIGGMISASLYAWFSPPTAADSAAPTGTKEARKVLFWYDPMYPNTRFDKPGKSPFMDMDLVAKYADEEEPPLPHPACVSIPRRPKTWG
jgi:Cu(I)/Ag(I) efflux system membrane fusion protein